MLNTPHLDGHRVPLDVRQLELAALEPVVEQDEAALLPGEDLHPVRPPREEDEQVPGVGILAEFLKDDAHQAVDGLPHVYRVLPDEDAERPLNRNHGCADQPDTGLAVA